MTIIARATNTYECAIIAPRCYPAIDRLEKALANQFWGYTKLPLNTGAWKIPGKPIEIENVNVYLVAIHQLQWQTLINTAKKFRYEANQDCVYVRRWDGQVFSIENEDWQAKNNPTHKPWPCQQDITRDDQLREEHGKRIAARQAANMPWED